MKKFIYYNDVMKDFVNDKKQYTLEGAIKYYKSIGATCIYVIKILDISSIFIFMM